MKEKPKKPPVPTGHDERSRERRLGEAREDGAAAPDGVSGSWP